MTTIDVTPLVSDIQVLQGVQTGSISVENACSLLKIDSVNTELTDILANVAEGMPAKMGLFCLVKARENLVLQAKAKEKKNQGFGEIRFTVGPSGGVCVYGLQRLPVTLYYSQWLRLFEKVCALQIFMDEYKGGKIFEGTTTRDGKKIPYVATMKLEKGVKAQ
jgi:hypothetical protein